MSGETATLEVIVKGFRNHDGQVLIALFASSGGFPDDPEKSFRRLVEPISRDVMTFTMRDVPVGRYAVSVFHDENADGEMQTDFFGRPTEGYGFSRNAEGIFGPPSFDDASFDLTGDSFTVHVEIDY